jgi:hypothetical protein
MDFELIKNRIESIKSNNQIMKIFNILYNNEEQYIINDVGLFIPLNILKTKTINELLNILKINRVIKPNESLERLKKLKKPNLTYQEKYLLKKINLNDDLL